MYYAELYLSRIEKNIEMGKWTEILQGFGILC